ncbi:MAG: M24 family metallopeptidase [Candidatus Heimdallarchaeota archaeon]
MIKDRQERLRKLMKESGSEGLILVPGVDMFYSVGLNAHQSERLTAAIIPQEGEPIFICPSFEANRMSKSIQSGSVRTWEEDQDPFKILGDILREIDLDKKQIALDSKLWFEWFLRVKKNLPDANYVDSSKIVQIARLIKSDGEIKLMRKATQIASEAIIASIGEATPGMTELDVAKIVNEKLAKDNGRPCFATVQSGPNTALPHAGPSERKIENNDVILIDAGPVYEGYMGDITITSVIGEPSDKFLKIYDSVYRANRAAFAKSKEGTIAEDVDKAARDVITKDGYGKHFTHRLGHGIGMEVHERPYIVTGNKLVLKAGMCHTIEPGIYIEGEFGVRIEDDVVVRKDGCEFLFETPRRIWE